MRVGVVEFSHFELEAASGGLFGLEPLLRSTLMTSRSRLIPLWYV